MRHELEVMELQLGAWSAKIGSLNAAHLQSGVHARFETVIYLDELRALHAIARSNFDRYRAAGAPERAELEPALEAAWDELATAMKRRPPPRTGS